MEKSERVWRRRRKVIGLALVLLTALHYGSLAGLYYLPELSRRNYVSENALSPGNSVSSFTERGLKRAASLGISNVSQACGAMERARFECFLHEGAAFTVLRAPKASGKEALLLSCTPQSFGLALSMLHTLRTQRWLARDFFLLVSDSPLAAHSWVRAYLGLEGGLRFHGARGRLEAALHLDFGAEEARAFDHVVLEAPSVESGGALPNLDLVNAFVVVSRGQGIRDTRLAHSLGALPEWVPAHMRELLSFLAHMVWGGSHSETHGVLNRYQVEAISVSLGGSSGRGGNALALMRSVEGTLRALNNLQERLHQSFYFYVLTSTQTYVSIADYMIPLGAACALLPFRMLTEVYDPDVRSSVLSGVMVLAVYVVGGALMYEWGSVWLHVGATLVAWKLLPRVRDHGLKTATLMFATLALVFLSLVNWALAMLAAFVLVPTLTFLRPQGSVLQAAALLCVDPGVLCAALVWHFESEVPPLVWALGTLVYWPAHRAALHMWF